MDTPAAQLTIPQSKARTEASIVGFCMGCGAILGALAFLASTWLLAKAGFGGIFLAIVIGGAVGGGCSLLVVPLLRRREVRRAKPVIAWGTAFVLVAWIAATGGSNPWSYFVAPLIFIGFSILAWIVLPVVSRTPGCCIGCNYDLRGSYEVGRCPECGLSIDPADQQRQTQSRPIRSGVVERLWAYCLRRPLILLLLFMLGGVVKIEAPRARRAWRSAPLQRALENINPPTTINLSEFTTFDWDTVYVYGPYSKPTPPAHINPRSWNSMTDQLESGWVDENEFLFVFVRHKDVAEYFHVKRRFDVSTEIHGQPIDRNEARFDFVSDRQTGRRKLTRPLYCMPADAGVE